ncbi:hypothetical protein NE237_005109 [Protea cynaroides]|uniref:Uncharacterized protein n=1 Tax=Protea cynaroides TaxID=273540 RepID=A0A9Q0QTY8_9MAGN|nr:hypothetical protein NE237_005109 [Protea cynaroides]
MQPWLDDLVDDLQSMSFKSTIIAKEINRSTSFGSETTWTASILASIPTKLYTPSSVPCWDRIRRIILEAPSDVLGLGDLRFIRKLGSGDIRIVYLRRSWSSWRSCELILADPLMVPCSNIISIIPFSAASIEELLSFFSLTTSEIATTADRHISVDFLLRFTNAGVSTTYAGVMSEAFGRVRSVVFQICIMINNFGTLDIYLIIIGFKESVSFTVHLNLRKTNYYLASIHVTCSKWNGTVSCEVRKNRSFELRGALS